MRILWFGLSFLVLSACESTEPVDDARMYPIDFVPDATDTDGVAYVVASTSDSTPVEPAGAFLDDISLSIGELNESFSASSFFYTANAEFLQDETTVTALATEPEAIIRINGVVTASGQASAPIALAEGANELTVEVDGADGGDTSLYLLTIFRDGPPAFGQQAYVKASNTGLGDDFGFSVAIDGDTLAVGAVLEDSDATGTNGDQNNNNADAAGAVYVYSRTGTTWTQQAYIKASNTGGLHLFGASVALDGDTLAVGARLENSGATGINGSQNNDGAVNSGAVYVFTRSGDIWGQQAYIKASNTDLGDEFGVSVALNDDTLAVGANNEAGASLGVNGDDSSNAASDAGAVYVYTRTGALWSQQAYIKASNTDADDWFGLAIALDGETLGVGAPYEDSRATGINGVDDNNETEDAGAVYVFTRAGSNIWTQQAYIKASNTDEGDQFGWSIALDEDTLAVGANFEASSATGIGGTQDNNVADASGAVYVFTRTGSTWTQQAYIKASNTNDDDQFGWSVALDGDNLAVGATEESSGATGIDGNQADNGHDSAGAAYLFTRTGSTWSQDTYIKASNTDTGDTFGHALALDNDTLVVGAPNESGGSTGIDGNASSNTMESSGAAYVFLKPEPLPTTTTP